MYHSDSYCKSCSHPEGLCRPTLQRKQRSTKHNCSTDIKKHCFVTECIISEMFWIQIKDSCMQIKKSGAETNEEENNGRSRARHFHERRPHFRTWHAETERKITEIPQRGPGRGICVCLCVSAEVWWVTVKACERRAMNISGIKSICRQRSCGTFAGLRSFGVNYL